MWKRGRRSWRSWSFPTWATSTQSRKAEPVTQKKGTQNEREKQFDSNIFQTIFPSRKRTIRSSLGHFTVQCRTSLMSTIRTKTPVRTNPNHHTSHRETPKIRKRHKQCNDGINAQGWKACTCSLPNLPRVWGHDNFPAATQILSIIWRQCRRHGERMVTRLPWCRPKRSLSSDRNGTWRKPPLKRVPVP